MGRVVVRVLSRGYSKLSDFEVGKILVCLRGLVRLILESMWENDRR